MTKPAIEASRLLRLLNSKRQATTRSTSQVRRKRQGKWPLFNSVHVHSDPEEMEAAHAAARAEVTPTTRQSLVWRVSRLQLDDLWVVSVQETGPRLRYVELDPTRTFISFPTSARSRLTVGGVETTMGGIVRHGAGGTFYEQTHGPTDWGILSLPTNEVARLVTAVAGCDVTAPRDALRVKPSPQALERFLRVHADTVAIAETTPHLLASEEVQRALKQTMMDAAAKALETTEIRKETAAQRSHGRIIRRFRQFLEENPGRPLYVPEACNAIGVPERTLRLCLQEHLAISPKRYLALRRLHMARRALLRAPRDCNVTDIAMEFGFWHLGRFSQYYRQLHGETPSETLARVR